MKNVYDDINWDYPHCGGIEVKEYKDRWSITKYSNYQGQRTNIKYSIPKTKISALDDVVYSIRNADMRDYITRKGQIVQ